MMKCEELTRLASEGMERTLSLRERAAMKFHLLMCDGCTNFTRQMTVLRSMSRAYAKRTDDPSDKTNPR